MTIHVGDVGTIILVDTKTTLTGASAVGIRAKKPVTGTVVNWTGTVHTNPKQIKYVTQTDDIDEAGEWEFQATLTIGSYTGSGIKGTFTVEPVVQ